MQLIQRYTDERYCNRQQVEAEVGLGAINEVWRRIKAYRQYFKIEATLLNQHYEFVLTPAILKKIIDVMTQFSLTASTIQLSEYKVHLTRLFNQYIPDSSVDDLVKMLPFIQLYMISNITHDELRNEAMLCVLKTYGYAHHYELFREVVEVVYADPFDRDHTLPFLNYLEQCSMKNQQKMLLFSQEKQLNETDLLLLHPAMSAKQCHFFVHHREYAKYYRIEDYMKQENCSYETARSHMQAMVNVGWYSKLKIGKKFVFTVSEC